MDDREDRIRVQAHRFWEEEGRPDGRAHEHWLRAEATLDGEGGSFRPVDAAEAPPEPMGDTQTHGAPAVDDAAGKPPLPHALEVDPNVVIDGGEYEPASEIETVRRTLEVPAKRRGRASPVADREGAMGGLSGSRVR